VTAGATRPWPWRAVALFIACLGLGAAVAAGLARGLDELSRDAVAALSTSVLAPMLEAWNWLGDIPITLAITLVAAAGLLLEGRRRAAAVVVASLLAGVVCSLLKLAFASPRPPGADVVDLLGGPSYGYPSAHVTRFLALWGTLAIIAISEGRLADGTRRRAIVALLAGGTILMGIARMSAGAHWLSDVIGGALLAAAWLALAVWLVRQGQQTAATEPRRHRSPPMATD
jgi:undecaprenyl-diphosphatase